MIVKRDRFIAESIRFAAAALIPSAEITVCRAAHEAFEALAHQAASLFICGLTLPDYDGLDLIAAIQEEHWAERILVITGRSDERTRELLHDLRVDGCFDYEAEQPAALAAAIQATFEGRRYFSAVRVDLHAPRGMIPLSRLLSPSQLQVFVMIGAGHDEQQAADHLGVSKHTVHTHLQHVMRKLGVQTRLQVMRQAVSRGFVRITPERVLYPGMEKALAARAAAARSPHVAAHETVFVAADL